MRIDANGFALSSTRCFLKGLKPGQSYKVPRAGGVRAGNQKNAGWRKRHGGGWCQPCALLLRTKSK